jgi:hypothetical protein
MSLNYLLDENVDPSYQDRIVHLREIV